MVNNDGLQVMNDEKRQKVEDPFDIFGIPQLNLDYAKSEINYIEPSEPINDTGPIRFEFGTFSGQKLDSSCTELEGDVEIWKISTNKKTTNGV